MGEVVIVRTGTANLASVRAGLRRAGAESKLSRDPAEIEDAPVLVLPGVGALGAAMEVLNDNGLVRPLKERIRAGRPTLCVCLGLQMLCESSEESAGVQGLGVIPARIRRFPDTVRVPQLGWNTVRPDSSCRWLRPGYAYFANSFCLDAPPEGWRTAETEHGIRFVAAMEKDGVLACQFHPELSGPWGHELLGRWLKESFGRPEKGDDAC